MKNIFRTIIAWAKSHPKQIIAATIGTTTTAALAIFIALYPEETLLAVALAGLGYLYVRDNRSAPSPIDYGYEQWYTLLHQLLYTHGDNWGTIVPDEPAQMAPCWPPIGQKGGIEVIRAEIEKRRGAPLTASQFKHKLQKETNTALLSGTVVGIPFISLDGNAPIFWVMDVEETATAYIVDTVYLNTTEKIAATHSILARRQQLRHRQMNPPKTTPTDEEF